MFTLISLLLMMYALVKYHNRCNRLAKKETGLYDDKVGAVVALTAVLMAIGTNFVMRLIYP